MGILSAAERIKAIRDEADAKIAELQREAASELAKKIAEAKSALRALEREYEQVTGKPVRDNAEDYTTTTGEKKRAPRLSEEEWANLSERAKAVIKGKKGVKMGQIIAELKEQGETAADTQIREALKRIKGLSTTGERAAMLYFVK